LNKINLKKKRKKEEEEEEEKDIGDLNYLI
jgi:hypothetical protein